MCVIVILSINDEMYDLSRANYQNSSSRPGLPSEYVGILGVSVARPTPVSELGSYLQQTASGPHHHQSASNTDSEAGG